MPHPIRLPALPLALLVTTACAAGARPPGYPPGGGGPAPIATTRSAAPLASAPAAASSPVAPPHVVVAPVVAPDPVERPGLATAWGEHTWSPITTTPFVRAEASPWATAVLHYNDAEGVAAHAAHLGTGLAPLETWAGDGDLAIAVIDDAGAPLPGLTAGGRTLLAARDGARYRIAVRNHTSARFEVVASVDGLDVIDGRPAGFDRRGYVVEAHGELVIDGFRHSEAEVAAFRFGKVSGSYAAATGDDRNVGVIGVALFAERGARWTPAELDRRDRATPFPAEPGRGFAVAP